MLSPIAKKHKRNAFHLERDELKVGRSTRPPLSKRAVSNRRQGQTSWNGAPQRKRSRRAHVMLASSAAVELEDLEKEVQEVKKLVELLVDHERLTEIKTEEVSPTESLANGAMW